MNKKLKKIEEIGLALMPMATSVGMIILIVFMAMLVCFFVKVNFFEDEKASAGQQVEHTLIEIQAELDQLKAAQRVFADE